MHYGIDRAKTMIEALESDKNIKASMLKAFDRKLELSGSDIFFFNEPFTPVSLTGTWCALECKHCNSYYLRHMLDGSSGKLYSHAVYLAGKGAKGILLSGGSTLEGSVPIYDQVDVIQKIKAETGLKISAHTGIVNGLQGEILSRCLDMALVDIPGDDETIHDILGIDAKVKGFEKSLKELSSAGIPIAPHIIAGLNKGRLKGEFRALELINKFDPAALVIVVFIPTEGTILEGEQPPALDDVVRIITRAREMFDVPLSLSCVRPGGRYRLMLDRYAILSGIDRIAVPSRSAFKTASELGLNIVEIPKMCCSYGGAQ